MVNHKYNINDGYSSMSTDILRYFNGYQGDDKDTFQIKDNRGGITTFITYEGNINFNEEKGICHKMILPNGKTYSDEYDEDNYWGIPNESKIEYVSGMSELLEKHKQFYDEANSRNPDNIPYTSYHTTFISKDLTSWKHILKGTKDDTFEMCDEVKEYLYNKSFYDKKSLEVEDSEGGITTFQTFKGNIDDKNKGTCLKMVLPNGESYTTEFPVNPKENVRYVNSIDELVNQQTIFYARRLRNDPNANIRFQAKLIK